ncbi:hypothetical protein HPB51_000806 [Rhipicephalus microplus]|uniref:Uncharacterized protein n=1 Tax=Rhipicephalus microplus TaxID=6941 RepID=A0A9J6E5D2_RHIMP|nr:hypothetical protein HPB51_000806 [Rhipicephalus microplus]
MHRTYESYAAEIHFRKHLRLADQMIEFHWKLQLRLLRDLVDKVRVSATSNVHVAEGICLPDFVLEVLGLGPKFAVQPQKNKPELVSIVRQVSKRVPEDQATRIINEEPTYGRRCIELTSHMQRRFTFESIYVWQTKMIEFHWKLQLRLLRDLVDKVRVSATSNVHVAEGICLPDFVLEVLGLGPKFAVQPQKNKPELVSIVRQVSKRVPEDQATRIINEVPKTLGIVYPYLIESRNDGGEKVIKISESITLNLKKSSVVSKEFLLRTHQDDIMEHNYLDGEILEQNLYHDAEAFASVIVLHEDGLKVEGIVSSMLGIKPMKTRERSADGSIPHAFYELPREKPNDKATGETQTLTFGYVKGIRKTEQPAPTAVIHARAPSLSFICNMTFKKRHVFFCFVPTDKTFADYTAGYPTRSGANFRLLLLSRLGWSIKYLPCEIPEGSRHFVGAIRSEGWGVGETVGMPSAMDDSTRRDHASFDLEISRACSAADVGLGCPHDGEQYRFFSSKDCPNSDGYIMTYWSNSSRSMKFSECCNRAISDLARVSECDSVHALLLSIISSRTYRLLKSVAAPELFSTKSVGVLKKILGDHLSVTTEHTTGGTSHLEKIVFPELIEVRDISAEKVLKITEDLTLYLEKSSVLAKEFLLRTYDGRLMQHTYLDGESLEENLYHDLRSLSSVMVSQESGLKVVRLNFTIAHTVYQ